MSAPVVTAPCEGVSVLSRVDTSSTIVRPNCCARSTRPQRQAEGAAVLQGMACVCVRSWRGGLGIGVETLNPKTPKPAATGCAAPALSSALLSVANIHVDLSVVGATI